MDSAGSVQMQNPHKYRDLEDSELLLLCQHGDAAAFGVLAERYRSNVIRVAISILRDPQDAEDEIQNAFCKAFEHIRDFQAEAKFSTWLTRIVVNQCLMRLRRARRARIDYMEQGMPDVRDQRRSTEQELAREQIAKVLHQEIRRTPPLLRSVFVMRDVEKRPITEVADQLGISVPAAKSRLLRARAELRKRLSRYHGRMGPATLIA